MAEQSSNTWNEGGGTGAAGGSDSSQQTMGELKEKVASVADAQKDRAAEGLGGIADAARQTSEGLRSQNETLASWVNAASDQLRHMADRLRDRPAAELMDDLSRFARERPAVFIGGAFLLGRGRAATRIPGTPLVPACRERLVRADRVPPTSVRISPT